jgi:hypothetical protein
MPWWTMLSRCSRSATPARSSSSTVPCSRTPARTRCSTYSRLRSSSTTDSIPSRWSRCDSSSPAGPAPTIPTWVRMPAMLCQPGRAGQGTRVGRRPGVGNAAATVASMAANRRTW